MTATDLIIFAKAPLRGFAKTRLIPALGEAGAEQVARGLVEHAVASSCAANFSHVELCVSPSVQHEVWATLNLPSLTLRWTEQVEGDLGARMASGCERVLRQGRSVVVTGTDCPDLTPERLNAAIAQLADYDVVIYPVSDGGYSLLGINQSLLPRVSEVLAGLFAGVPWSTPEVYSTTQARIKALGLRCWVGETLHDIDEGEDLVHLPEGF